MNRSHFSLLPALLLILAPAGCLALSNEGPIPIERMDPVAGLLESYDGSTPDRDGAMALIVRPTTSGSHISEALRVRRVPGLSEYSDTIRWDALPTGMLNVSLTNGVLEKSGWSAASGRGVATLQVELQRFDVDLAGGAPAFVLDASWTLAHGSAADGNQVLNERFVVREPLPDRSAASISAAAAKAIQGLIEAIPDGFPQG